MKRAVAMVLVMVCLGGCGHPWRSPGAMANYQRLHFGYLSSLYPAGMTRQEVMDVTRGRHRAYIGLPMSVEAQEAYADSPIGQDLPVMIPAVAQMTGVEPQSVDVLEFFGGPSGAMVEARYVFYDADDRVLTAFGSPWE